MFPFSLWHCLTSRSAPPHSPGKERLKEILPLSAFIYYTYTYRNTVAFLLGIPLRAAVKLYRWSTRAQPSVLLKGMSEDPGHPRFDPANRTASPGSYLPRGRATEGGAASLWFSHEYLTCSQCLWSGSQLYPMPRTGALWIRGGSVGGQMAQIQV